MNAEAVEKTRTRLALLPDIILSSRRFLVWKGVYNERRKKTLKIPYYTSGLPRIGILDTEDDLNGLSTMEEALKALKNNPDFSGVGFALAGDGIGAFDLDDCLTPDGELDPNHPGAKIVAESEARGAYIEISPSGRGLRILGASSITEAYSKDKLEYWGSRHFVTLTGSLWSGAKGWASLEDLRAPLQKLRPVRTEEDDEAIITKRTLQELESALAVMDSDERDLWIRMGHALKNLGTRGYELWLKWSAKSDKFEEHDAERVWDSLQPQRTNHKAVFAEAQANWGWANPRKRTTTPSADPPQDPENEEPIRDLLKNSLDLGLQELYPTEFVLDGFLPTGVTLVAGAWGAGKSTNLIPVFASVAHLAPEEWGFRSQLRRHVVWITEAPDQARDTIYSLSKQEGSAPWNEYKRWFHLLPSHRSGAAALAKALAEVVRDLTYTKEVHREDGTSGVFKVKPVIILDTTSSNLDLENESDNSEVGAAMAALKENLPGIPLVLVGHTPKALVKADVMDMTFRGAGAWEADSVATYYLVHDADTGFRFLAIRKSRFAPDYTEISFGQDGGRELLNTPWGEPQSKAYLHGVPCRSTGEERKAAQKAAKEEAKEEAQESLLTDRQTKILNEVIKAAGVGRALSKRLLKELIGGRPEFITQAISRLEEASLVRVHTLDAAQSEILGFSSKAHNTEIILPVEVDLQDLLSRARNTAGGPK